MSSQVLVVTAEMCWGLSCQAQLVVILGTQYYDAGRSMGADYPVTDLLQMMGRASRPDIDDAGRCILLHACVGIISRGNDDGGNFSAQSILAWVQQEGV